MSLNFKRRLLGLQERMVDQGLDLVVYGSCQNFQYLTGLLIDWRRGTDLGSWVNNVFVPREGEPILTLAEAFSEHASETWIGDIRVLERGGCYGELVDRVVSDLDLKGGRVGLGDHVWGSTAAEVARAVEGADLQGAEALMTT